MIWYCIVTNITVTANFTDIFGQFIKNIFSFPVRLNVKKICSQK